MNPERNVFLGGGKLIAGGLVAFLLGGIVLSVGAAYDVRGALVAYLSAYAWLVSLTLGALIFLMIVNAMNATWPVAVRRILEALTGLLPLAALGFVPIALGVVTIYPWANPSAEHDRALREVVHHNRAYLDPTAFVLRGIGYFIVWLALAYFLRQWSLRGDRLPAEAAKKDRLRALSSAGLPAVGLTLTFAGIDWLMSLSPTWYSSMFGVYWFAGGFLCAIALVMLFTWGAQRSGMMPRVGRSHYHALGRMMLAFTIFWAYIAYFQFFLIWIANKPHEVGFFVARAKGIWGFLSLALGLGRFVLPFFALLSYRIKQRPATLAPVAVWIVVTHWLDMLWLVVPALRSEGPIIHALDVAAIVCVGGAALAFGVFRIRGQSIVPKNDPALEAAYRYESA